MRSILNFNIEGLYTYLDSLSNQSEEIGDIQLGRYVDEEEVLGELAENLLLYDEILIKTTTFGELSLLIKWFGYKRLLSLLSKNILKFIHTKSHIGYIRESSNFMHTGIVRIGLAEDSKRHTKATWSDEDPEIACEYSLRRFVKLSPKKAKELARRVAKRTSHLPISMFTIYDDIFNDLKKNSSLLRQLGIKNSRLWDLDNKDPSDYIFIRKLLQVASSIDQISLSLALEHKDYTTERFYSYVIDTITKERQKKSSQILNTYLAYRQIPTISNLVKTKKLTIKDILDLRESKEGVKFRNNIDNNWQPEVFNDEYRYLGFELKDLGIRTVKFLSFEGLSSLIPGASMVTGATSEIVDTIQSRNKYINSPAMFMLEIEKKLKR